MNIKEVKEEIKSAMMAYFTKDKYGDYGLSLETEVLPELTGSRWGNSH